MEYHLKPLGKMCAGTGEELRPGTICYSVVVEQGEELVRLDFSEAGWKGMPENAIAQWKNIVPYPIETKRNPLDPEALMAYFEQLTEEANPLCENLRYILAILLVRKRKLKLEEPRVEGDSEILQLTATEGVGNYEVRDPQLTEAEMMELQETLNAHLAAEIQSH